VVTGVRGGFREPEGDVDEYTSVSMVLALLEHGKPYMVYIDASRVGLGCVLM